METVGVVGTGAMGRALLHRLSLAKVPATAYDQDSDALHRARGEGAAVADSPAAVARGSSIVDVVVRTDDELLDATLGSAGVLEGAATGTLVLLHSTTLPQTTIRIAEAAKSRDVRRHRRRHVGRAGRCARWPPPFSGGWSSRAGGASATASASDGRAGHPRRAAWHGQRGQADSQPAVRRPDPDGARGTAGRRGGGHSLTRRPSISCAISPQSGVPSSSGSARSTRRAPTQLRTLASTPCLRTCRLPESWPSSTGSKRQSSARSQTAALRLTR